LKTTAEVTHRCLYIFFAALAGVGYVPPPSSSSGLASASAAEFNPGAPVFDAAADPRELQIKAMEEQRALEIEWSKKRRPQDVSSLLFHSNHRARFMFGEGRNSS
jgi:hypothetical protein